MKRRGGKRKEDWGEGKRIEGINCGSERGDIYIYIYIPVGFPGPSTRFRINDFRYRFPSAEPLFREMLRVDPWRRSLLALLLSSSLSRVSPPSLLDPISVIPLRHGRLKEWRLVARTRGESGWGEEGVGRGSSKISEKKRKKKDR